jgi:hypothetical protein
MESGSTAVMRAGRMAWVPMGITVWNSAFLY